MVIMMQYDIQPVRKQAPDLLFDWQLDVERLEREAQTAAKSRRPDDWALVEAECSLDLIDAELAAVRKSKSDPALVATTVTHLTQWRARVGRVIDRLRALAL
jgi:hypothetical protein